MRTILIERSLQVRGRMQSPGCLDPQPAIDADRPVG